MKQETKASSRFAPGTSGNPAGKPRGVRHKSTVLLQALLEKGAQEIVETVITQAKAGDLTACRLVLDRLMPVAKERPIKIKLPEIVTAADAAAAQDAILQAVAAGELLPTEGTNLAGIVEARRKAIETEDLERQLMALEANRT